VRVLLDTVALIFAVESPERLSKRAAAILQNTENILELSAISLSEIAVKAARGKLKFSAADTRLRTWTFAYCHTPRTMHSFFSIYRPCTQIPSTVRSSPKLYMKRSQ
jgi:PIN domain nuclease of toxin-antitoxin system